MLTPTVDAPISVDAQEVNEASEAGRASPGRVSGPPSGEGWFRAAAAADLDGKGRKIVETQTSARADQLAPSALVICTLHPQRLLANVAIETSACLGPVPSRTRW